MESAKKVERFTGVELPLDFTDELRPVFNFFYLSFIVSHQVVALTKDENTKMKMALAFMSKIIMVRQLDCVEYLLSEEIRRR